MNNYSTVQAVDRALHVLEILKSYPKGLGVTELSYKLNVSKSTIHRLLMSLIQKGYVKQEESLEKYSLGLQLIELGEIVSENLDIRQITSPHLDQLAEKSGETVHLVIMDNLEIVYIDKRESYATIRMFSRIGRSAPMFCTGAGKSILAFLPDNRIDQVLTERPMKAFTQNTITSKREMKEHILHIRDQGYAIDNEEHEEGIKCAAAPIFDYRGNVIAGVSVTCPTMRLYGDAFAEIIKDVVETAQNISAEFGSNHEY